MKRLILTAVCLLALTGTAQAQEFSAGSTLAHAHRAARHWWPAMDNCTITTGVRRDGSFQAIPYIQCVTVAAHYGNTPAPPMVGIPVNSPQAQAFNHNYCPNKPNGWCTPPANVVNITPGYQGN